MSKFISRNACVVSQGDLIMNINEAANKHKANGKKIINGSIGMLFDEDGKLASFPVVDEYLKNNINEQCKKYDAITGDKEYKEAIKKWLFENVDLSKVYFNVTATMGATGALSSVIKCYVSQDEFILVPSIRWGNYDSIALEVGVNIKEYNLILDDKFDIENLKRQVLFSCEKLGKAIVLINDPCQNPTGYSLSEEEWDEILSFFKETSKKYSILLIDDIAYINYKNGSYNQIFQKFVDSVNDNFLITICFSASKTLQIYGLRGGALISLASSKEIDKEFENVTKIYCRATWSSPNHLATDVMSYVFKDDWAKSSLLDGLKCFTNMLNERANIFIEEAKECELHHYPYLGGFFILVMCENNIEVANRLMEKGIFVVPMCGGLRISIASISKKDIKGLAKEIKKAL